MRKFLKEEKAQGAIEYILLAGGIIVAAVVIFAIYSRITQTAGSSLALSANRSTNLMANSVNNAIATGGF